MILRAHASEVHRCVLSLCHSCHHFSCMLCLQAWLWPPSPSSGLFKPCFILTTVADALVPVLVVFLLHSFIVVFVCYLILRILIRSVSWSSFSLGWPKIPLFFSFNYCLFEKRHSMRVSNPLLSNHASCITVGDCIVLVVFALQRHVETRVSRQTVVISREIRQWQWLKLHCLHACMHLWTSFALLFPVNRGSVPLGSLFSYFSEAHYIFCWAVCVCGGKGASHAPWIRRHWNIHAPWCRSLVKGFSELQYKRWLATRLY